eukprot:gene21205-22011_t
MPVGQMAQLVKAAIKAGQHPKDDYCALDTLTLLSLSQAAAPHIEPGRLEVRVSEYYRKLKQAVAPPAPGGPPLGSSADVGTNGEGREGYSTTTVGPKGTVAAVEVRLSGKERDPRRRGTRPLAAESVSGAEGAGPIGPVLGLGIGGEEVEVIEGWERHLLPRDHEDKLAAAAAAGSRGSSSYGSRSKYPRLGYTPQQGEPVAASQDMQISEDNGVGLGADGSGMVEPVRGDAAGKLGKDRTGLGVAGAGESNPDLLLKGIDMNQYRKMLSSEYHSRISDRG